MQEGFSLDPALAALPGEAWQPIETFSVSRRNEPLFFWIVPKAPEEAYVNTSGDPIFGTFPPRLHMGKFGTWSSLAKATHWREMPAPPAAASGVPEESK